MYMYMKLAASRALWDSTYIHVAIGYMYLGLADELRLVKGIYFTGRIKVQIQIHVYILFFDTERRNLRAYRTRTVNYTYTCIYQSELPSRTTHVYM